MADPPFEDRWGPEWHQDLDEEAGADAQPDGKVRWPAQWHPGIDDKSAIRATPYVRKDPRCLPLRPRLFGNQLLRGSLSTILAPGGIGKTTYTVSVALSCATGRDILDTRLWEGPLRVWLWNLEDSMGEIEKQIEAACLHWGIEPNDHDGRLFVDSGLEGAGLCIAVEDANGFRLLEPKIEELVAELKAREMDVLIVDPFVSSHQVSENNNGAIDAVAKRWARVAVQANCSICLVHHTSKLKGEEASAEHSRGAVALPFAARSNIVLNRMTKQEAESFGVPEEHRRLHFRAYDDKNNRAPPADKSSWYKLHSVDLGNGSSERPGDQVGVVMPWAPPDAFDGVTADHLQRVQGLVADGNYRASVQSPGWVGYAVAEVLGLDLDEASDKKRVGTLVSRWLKNGALVQRTEKDPTSRKDVPFIRVGHVAPL